MAPSSSRKIQSLTCIRKASLFKIASLLLVLSLLSLLLVKVDHMATQIITNTKTVAGHNLAQTPWHHFKPKSFNEEEGVSRYTKALNHIKCSYLSCIPHIISPSHPKQSQNSSNPTAMCPSFFRWIHHDLEPWAQTRISPSNLMEAQQFAAFRVVIVQGRLYVEHYYACTQTRAMFTIWGLLQLLKRYPGMIPDVDIMFDCMDRPRFNRGRYKPKKRWPPPPLFRYCTDEWSFDIPFPDWSFWGWPETNIQPWDEEFRSIKKGSDEVKWEKKIDHAYWRGNPYVGSPARMELLKCNDPRKCGAEVYIQDWVQETKSGFPKSKLADQCKHRYKIYAEGFAWSVSLKYIVSCGSMSLLISPVFEDFFSRGLVPKQNYWPVSRDDMCRSIKYAVEWGNANMSEAEKIGKGGQDLLRLLDMEKVYDYMYHLINEYAKLLNFKPSPPPSAQVVCSESVLCYADPRSTEFLKKSSAKPSSSLPCVLQVADSGLVESWMQNKRKVISEVHEMEKAFGQQNMSIGVYH
ncbi:hypothetical protein ACHQM5_020793 [Ranunculus cassubicifolius]